MIPLDRVVFQTSSVRVGAFRCPVHDSRFRDSGPIEHHIVVFPRAPVWIHHAGQNPFLADPRTVTIYNKGQQYTRRSAASDGDRSDWFAVSPDVALAIARELDPRSAPEAPYRPHFSPSDLALYARQRALFLALERGLVDPLAAEETVFDIVAAVLSRAYRVRRRPHSSHTAARRDLVERARAELAVDVGAHTDVASLASRLGTSPYHLCRVFRDETGTTLHAYRLDLRCRAALERLTESSVDISRLALELGFSSHSHFTAVLRQRLGTTPSALRRHVAALLA